MISKHRLRWLLGLPIRAYYRDRVVSKLGEAGQLLHFKPSETPRLLGRLSRMEASTREEWASLLRPGDSIIDCGAHIGMTTHRFFSILNGDCQIWAIEPNPRSFRLLKLNSAALGSVVLFEVAIGDSDGFVSFADNVRHSALSRLEQFKSGTRVTSGYWNVAFSVEVTLRSLDSLLREHESFHPDFLKIDVEGAAGLLVQGAIETLKQFKPVCYVEYHTRGEIETVRDTLGALGYRGVRFHGSDNPCWTDLGSEPLYFVHPDSARADVVSRGCASAV